MQHGAEVRVRERLEGVGLYILWPKHSCWFKAKLAELKGVERISPAPPFSADHCQEVIRLKAEAGF